jgi:hypothetical protein
MELKVLQSQTRKQHIMRNANARKYNYGDKKMPEKAGLAHKLLSKRGGNGPACGIITLQRIKQRQKVLNPPLYIDASPRSAHLI